MTDKQIIIDEFNASEYAKTAFELAKETLAEKDQLREYYDKLLQRKEQECEGLTSKCSQLKQTLEEIKPILEFYANSKMGEEQPDRTYKIMLSGGYIMIYDPKPAREALRKINEVEDES